MNKANYIVVNDTKFELEDLKARHGEYYIPNLLEFEWIEGVRIINGVESSTSADSYASTDYVPIPFGFTVADFYISYSSAEISYYDADKTYITKASYGSEKPSKAVYMRLCVQLLVLNGLYTTYGEVANKGLFKYMSILPLNADNRETGICKGISLMDVIYSPLKASAVINFTGDSNTYGAGVDQKSWAYYFAKKLKDTYDGKRLYYYLASPYIKYHGMLQTQSVTNGALKGNTSATAETNNQHISIKTNATIVYYGSPSTTLSESNHAVFVDGEQVTGTANTDTEWYITLDGNEHEVKFMVVGNNTISNPYFSIEKHLTFNNYGVAGRNSQNVDCTGIDSCDYYIIMIGTNDGNNNVYTGIQNGAFLHKFSAFIDKCIFIEPIYSVSDQNVAHLIQTVDMMGGKIMRLPYLNSIMAMHEAETMQSDGLHFSTVGHLMICNAVSDELGFPANLSPTYTEDDTVGNVFHNLA